MIYIVPGILILGIFGAGYDKQENAKTDNDEIVIVETNKLIFIRALKIFQFIIGLELLGEGFKPLIDTYIIPLDIRYLYWITY